MKNPRRRVGRTDSFSKKRARQRIGQNLQIESLEQRQLLAGDVGQLAHHNPWYATDVNNDLLVTPMDALVIVNAINRTGGGDLADVTPEPGKFYDVSGDNNLSAIDALLVINSLNRGEGAGDELFELYLDFTDNDGNSLVDPTSRTANFSVGEVANLELLFTDMRTGFQAAQGLFEAYADVLSDETGWFEPVVNESQLFTFSSNTITTSSTGNIILSQEGRSETATIDVASSLFRSRPNAAIEQAMIQTFGYTDAQINSKGPSAIEGSTYDVAIRFIGEEFNDVDIPNFSVDVSGVVSSGAVTGVVEEIPQRLADGTFNNEALIVAYDAVVDARSRTADFREIYTSLIPLVEFNDNPSDQVADGFTDWGNVGPIQAGGLISFLNNTYDPTVPFEAFSIPIRFIAPVVQSELRIELPTTDDGQVRLSAYGAVPPVNGQIDRQLLPSEVLLDESSRITVTVTQTITTVADNITVDEDGSRTINPVTNDTNLGTGGNGALTLVSATNGLNGTVTVNGNQVTYTPAPNYFGNDTFTYTVRNTENDTAVGTVNVSVTSVNDPPTASNFNITVVEATTRQLANSEFISRSSAGPANENQTPTLIAVGTPTRGTATLNADGSVTYVAPSGFQGNDQFTYTISDGSPASDNGLVTATVTVNVTDVNDPPVASDDTITVTEDTPVTYTAAEFRAAVLANDTAGPANEGASGQTISLVPGTLTGSAGGTLVQNADGSVTYTPPDNVFGNAAETIVYTIQDSGEPVLTDSATITINITPVNDAPIAVNDPDLTIDELTTDEPLDVLANDSAGPLEDSTQTIRIVEIVSQPSNGSATISSDGSQILYTPNEDFTGLDSLTYRIEDSLGAQSNVATATIDVVPVIRPRAKNDSYTVAEDSGTTTLNITSNDLPNEGETVVLDTVGTITAAEGTLTKTGNSVQFTPAADFFGTVTFTYTITDTSNPVIDTPEEEASVQGTVTVTVTPVNDNPVFVVDDPVPATEDTTVTIQASSLLSNDLKGPANESGQVLTVQAVASTSQNGGTVSLQGQTISFTPRADYNDVDSFTYTISDGAGGTATGTVTLNIAAVNDAPVLNLATNLQAAEDTTTTFTPTSVLGSSRPGPATATDESGQTLTIVSVGSNGATANGGTVSLVNGQVQYRAAQDYFGEDSFAVTVRDNGTGNVTSIGTLTLTVTPVNDAPQFGDPPLLAFNKSTATYTSAQLLAASTVGPPNETGTLSVTAVQSITSGANATVGTLSFDSATGTVTYRAPDGFKGTDRFQITISDGQLTTTGIVTIDVREFEPSTVRGGVFFDYIESVSNPVRDGVQGDNEPGLEMARVHLISGATENVTGTAINTMLMTDANGDFEFTNVPPGTYRLRFDLPIMAVDGDDIAGTKGDSDTIANQFTFEIAQPGGQTAEDYNFTLLGLTGRTGNALDLLVSSYMNSNPGVAGDTGNGSQGAKAYLDSSGMQQWFVPKRGFEDVLYGEINVNQAGDTASLTVVMANGDVLTGIIPESRRVILKDSSTGGYAVQIFGSVDSFGLLPDGTLNDSEIGLLRYQDAVDMLLAQSGSVV